MKKVLLVSNRVFHYRARIYNAFSRMWKERGYEFHVVNKSFPDNVVIAGVPARIVRYKNEEHEQ